MTSLSSSVTSSSTVVPWQAGDFDRIPDDTIVKANGHLTHKEVFALARTCRQLFSKFGNLVVNVETSKNGIYWALVANRLVVEHLDMRGCSKEDSYRLTGLGIRLYNAGDSTKDYFPRLRTITFYEYKKPYQPYIVEGNEDSDSFETIEMHHNQYRYPFSAFDIVTILSRCPSIEKVNRATTHCYSPELKSIGQKLGWDDEKIYRVFGIQWVIEDDVLANMQPGNFLDGMGDDFAAAPAEPENLAEVEDDAAAPAAVNDDEALAQDLQAEEFGGNL